MDFLEAAIEFEDTIVRYRLIPKEEVEGLEWGITIYSLFNKNTSKNF